MDKLWVLRCLSAKLALPPTLAAAAPAVNGGASAPLPAPTGAARPTGPASLPVRVAGPGGAGCGCGVASGAFAGAAAGPLPSAGGRLMNLDEPAELVSVKGTAAPPSAALPGLEAAAFPEAALAAWSPATGMPGGGGSPGGADGGPATPGGTSWGAMPGGGPAAPAGGAVAPPAP